MFIGKFVFMKFMLFRDQYPQNGYLARLKNQLMNLGIPEPLETEVSNLVIHDAKSVQHGTGTLPTSPERNGLNTPGVLRQCD